MRDEQVKLHQGDCLEKLKLIPDKSVNLVLIDPPYNISKADWDKWKTVEDYVEFMGKVFLECQRVLKDNGSFYFFHNDFLQMAELQCWIRKNTSFIFKSMLTIDKSDNSYIKDMYGSQNHFRNYLNMNEYLVYYSLEEDFSNIKKYLRLEKKKSGLTILEINKLFGINISDGIAKRYFGDSQWELPTEEKYKLMQETGHWSKPYSDLKREYESRRTVFNGGAGVFNCLRYSFKGDKKYKHPCVKPTTLMEDIIAISSNEGDIVLDCFMGSGSTGVAAINTNRKFIGIELDENYFNISKERIDKALELQQSN